MGIAVARRGASMMATIGLPLEEHSMMALGG
jgi:hypothetical protein